MQSAAAAVGQFLQIPGSLTIFVARPAARGWAAALRPLRVLRERITDEWIEGPTTACGRIRTRVRPGTAAGVEDPALRRIHFGVVANRVDQGPGFFHFIEGVLVVGAAAGSVDAVGEEDDGFPALNLRQAVDHLVD